MPSLPAPLARRRERMTCSAASHFAVQYFFVSSAGRWRMIQSAFQAARSGNSEGWIAYFKGRSRLLDRNHPLRRGAQRLPRLREGKNTLRQRRDELGKIDSQRAGMLLSETVSTWNRNESWEVHISHHERARLYARVSPATRVTDLVSLRRIVDSLRSLSPAEVRNLVGKDHRVDLGEREGRVARRLAEELKAAGIQTERIGDQLPTGQPNPRHGLDHRGRQRSQKGRRRNDRGRLPRGENRGLAWIDRKNGRLANGSKKGAALEAV